MLVLSVSRSVHARIQRQT